MDKTSSVAFKLTKSIDKEVTRYGITADKYINPQEISTRLSEKYRVEKDAEAKLWEDLLAKVRYSMPSATEQKLTAIVFRQIQDIKHGKKEAFDPELTGRPDISRSMGSKAPAPIKPNTRRTRVLPAGGSS